MIIIFFWIIFAMGVGFYASSKGRSGIGFFLLAIIFSPLIAFIIALLVSSNNQIVQQVVATSNSMKKCPRCAELVQLEAQVCKHCSNELGAVIKQVSSSSNDQQ